MSVFTVYLRLGFEHLLDLQGADHILFIAVLCAAYTLREWKELLVLVTAFTVGHSLSLALATVGAVRVDTALVEFLIPVTIAAAAAVNVLFSRTPPPLPDQAEGRVRALGQRRTKYGLALVFGLIHGLGFSNFLRLMLGEESSLLLPLLSFNVGLELAQIVVAVTVLALAWAFARVFSRTQRVWNVALSLVLGLVAVVMAADRWPPW